MSGHNNIILINYYSDSVTPGLGVRARELHWNYTIITLVLMHTLLLDYQHLVRSRPGARRKGYRSPS